MCNIFIWNWSNRINVQSALWILMAWCFSTRASVATMLTTHPCISRCLRVNKRDPWCFILFDVWYLTSHTDSETCLLSDNCVFLLILVRPIFVFPALITSDISSPRSLFSLYLSLSFIKNRLVMKPTLLSLVVLQVVFMIISSAPNKSKVGSVTTLGFQCYSDIIWVIKHFILLIITLLWNTMKWTVFYTPVLLCSESTWRVILRTADQ